MDNIRSLLEEIGNPQTTFPVAHIAGSKGKGSTATVINGILSEAGYTTAVYTSPHLNDFRERIRLNGALVSKEAVIESVRKIKAVHNPERTTFFEFTTAVAFDCIAQAAPDLAIIEVGLGGRLDATNTVAPLVTAITDISREHEDYLGEGIAAVAREKAGIIKPGVPLVTGAVRREAREVIFDTARGLDAPVRLFGRDFIGKRTGLNRFTYVSERRTLDNLSFAMPGGHQVKNCSLASAVVEELERQGFTIPEAAYRDGIAGAVMAGRFETVRESPRVIIDGAHTPESMRLLGSSFRQVFPGVRPLILMGMLKEKNYRVMARILASMGREAVCVPPMGDRALPAEDLAAAAAQCGIPVGIADSIEDGLRTLLEKARPDDVILAAGSLYMIGPVRRACGRDDE